MKDNKRKNRNASVRRLTAEGILLLALLCAAVLLTAAAVWCVHRANRYRASAEAAARQTEVPAVETASPSPEASPTPEPTPSPSPTPKPSSPSRVETLEYTAHDYVRDPGEEKTKRLAVYVPKDYDPSEEYDVVFLMHVLGQNETFWTEQLGFASVLDELIESGACRPVVAVFPDGYYHEDLRGVTGRSEYYEQFAQEFRKDILPFVRSQYSISSAPERTGFIGASFGAYMTVNSILRENADLVGNYGYIGGGDIDPSLISSRWSANGFTSPRISMFYIGEGDRDDLGTVQSSYQKLLAYGGSFDESNLVFSVLSGYAHEPAEWILGAKEALALFYP